MKKGSVLLKNLSDLEHIADFKWLTSKALPHFGLKRVAISWSDSDKRWPDVWCEFGEPSTITVTKEWARQKMHERRKRLVHELLHISKGLEHGKIDGLNFNTHPELDSYSMEVYRRIK